jgi:hypothetical protein
MLQNAPVQLGDIETNPPVRTPEAAGNRTAVFVTAPLLRASLVTCPSFPDAATHKLSVIKLRRPARWSLGHQIVKGHLCKGDP